MAAMIKIIATTINNSMREKPFCFCIYFFLSRYFGGWEQSLKNCRLSTFATKSWPDGPIWEAGYAGKYLKLSPRKYACKRITKSRSVGQFKQQRPMTASVFTIAQ